MRINSVRRRQTFVLQQACLEGLEGRRYLSVANTGVAEVAGRLTFDNNADISRALTPVERQWLAENAQDGGATTASTPTAAPAGPIDSMGEYEAMEGLVISWAGTAAQKTILAQIARKVTVEGGGRMYVGVTSAANQSAATTSFNGQGVDLAKVTFFTVAIDTIWARDYGPRYVYEGDVRVIADHDYNRPRPNDDNEPVTFAGFKKQQLYQMGLNGTALVHGGGNYHLSGTGDAYATTLVNSENPSFTTAQIQSIWNSYQGNDTTIVQQFPLSIDSTGHIDMWMYIAGDRKAFISDWPNNSGSTQDQICDSTAALMQSRGYEVTRLPAYSIGGVHYTFANMVMMNNVVLVPQYTGGPGATVSAQALATVQAALPAGKTAYGINADGIVGSAGVFHCIVQHVPLHRGLAGANGGLAPTALVREPVVTGTGTQQMTISWITDDDAPVAAAAGVQGVDLQLSTDGGQTFVTSIATNQPALGSFVWNVPAGINTDMARVRVVARDGVGNTGFDANNANFTLGTPASAVPAQPSLAAAADSGPDGDGITNFNNASLATRLSFNVNNTAVGAVVSVYANGQLIGTQTATGTTTEVFTNGATPISDGTYTVTARQKMGSLPQSADSVVATLTVDTAAPLVTSGAFAFETEQRVDVLASEVATLAGATLTNSTTGQILTGSQLTITGSGATIGVRPASGPLADGNWQLSLPVGALTDIAGNASTSPGTFNFYVLAGDANRDRTVNINDFAILAGTFGQAGHTFSQGNFNYTGNVDIADFALLAGNFGATLPAARPAASLFSSSLVAPAAMFRSPSFRPSIAVDMRIGGELITEPGIL